MTQIPRHKVITAISRSALEEEMKKDLAQGWRMIGEPALAVPKDMSKPPYWAQALYLSDIRIETEFTKLGTPAESKLTKLEADSSAPAHSR